MPVIEWSENYRTGIPSIDKEHQHLFALVNELHDKVEASAEDVSILSTIKALNDYVKSHFSAEESLMGICQYCDIEKHKEMHRKLASRIASYKEAFEHDPQLFDMEDFVKFLSHWLQGHILQSDMAYVPDVKQKIKDL